MPPDVRKGSAFPMLLSGEFSEATPRECLGGVASDNFRRSRKAIGFPHIGRQSRKHSRPLPRAVLQCFPRDFLVVKVKNFAADDLIVLMAFAGD